MAILKENWRESVDEIEKGLKACIESLDRYDQQYSTVLTIESSPPGDPLRHIPARTDGWAERLATAGERAAQVERLLDEQQAVWQKFQSAVAEFRDSLEQSPLRSR